MEFTHRIKRAIKNKLLAPLMKKYSLSIAGLIAHNLAILPGNPAHETFYKYGFHLLRKHYYLPIPEETDVSGNFWENQSELVGVDMNSELALQNLENVFPIYMPEFRSKFPLHKTGDPKRFYLINGGYMAVDAHVYYAFIRHYKPRRIIEIGAGNSTLLGGIACLQNQQETGRPTELISIDPFPPSWLAGGIPGVSRILESRIQDVGMEMFTALEKDDILFIDSSHVIRAGGDVQFEYLEILPRLSPGVLVHIHDISLPRAYPKVYYENQLYWNEQYFLQAFLLFNSHFEVLWPGNYMILKYPEKVRAVFPEYHDMRQQYPLSEPSAFWMRVRQ